LIIAADDKESELLFNELHKVFETDIQRIDSLTGDKEEECIKKAGNPGQITVSTDMIGRGTDIPIHNKAAKVHGLNVMLTYLPRVRDLMQIQGRSARFGAKGETSIVLDKSKLKKELGKTTLTDGYYLDAEHYIQREQAKMDRKEQCTRLLKHTVGDFRQPFTYQFSHELLSRVKPDDQKRFVPMWTKFWDDSDKLWNVAWDDIQLKLSSGQVKVSDLSPLLQQYETDVSKLWGTLVTQLSDLKCIDTVGNPVNAVYPALTFKKPKLQLSSATQSLLDDFDMNKLAFSTKRYTNFDPGHEGRAVNYEHWYTPVIASLKGYANLLPFVHFSDARRPFANIRSWLEGHGRLFPELRANPGRWKWIGAGAFGAIGTAIGVGLILTGVLAPIGFTVLGITFAGLALSAVLFGLAGLVAGAIVGFLGGGGVEIALSKNTIKDQSDSGFNLKDLDVTEKDQKNSTQTMTDLFSSKRTVLNMEKRDSSQANEQAQKPPDHFPNPFTHPEPATRNRSVSEQTHPTDNKTT